MTRLHAVVEVPPCRHFAPLASEFSGRLLCPGMSIMSMDTDEQEINVRATHGWDLD